MASPLILLPPSEGKAPGGSGAQWSPGTMAIDLDDERALVMAALARAMRGNEASRSRLLGVKGRTLAAATAADHDVASSRTMPAIERYTGVLFDALDHTSLSAAHRRRLASSLVIVSGLWGLVAPGDPIPDYKLKMGASLPQLGKLSTWWRDAVTARLVERARDRTVWNLLPSEHAAAFRPPADLLRFTVRFLEPRADGSLVAVSHANKYLKGSLVRFLLAHPTAGPHDLGSWEHPEGYRLDPTLTTNSHGLTTLSMVR
jgi:cytoplasmic iron level regulating protein YaaA (DUF328/UPF0246 family)